MHLPLDSRQQQRPLWEADLCCCRYAAVHVYLAPCVTGRVQAHRVTSCVCEQLLQRLLSGGLFVGSPHPGCLRPQLTAGIAGPAPERVRAACELPMCPLKQPRTDLYIQRLGRPGCREAFTQLTLRPETPPAGEIANHLRSCSACVRLRDDVTPARRATRGTTGRTAAGTVDRRALPPCQGRPQTLGCAPLLATPLGRTRADAPAERSYTRRAPAPVGVDDHGA